MKNIPLILLVASIALSSLTGCEPKESVDPNTSPTTTFNPADYVEYVTCKVGNTVFTSGNKTLNSSSIVTLFLGSWLYIEASNGDFVAGNVAPAEVRLQLSNFSKTTVKNYDIRGIAPLEILKLNGTSTSNGDYLDWDNGSGTAQTEAIKITQIKDGFVYGTFTCKVYNIKDRTKVSDLTAGSFKVRIP